jgi:hypothetical protein
MARDFGVVAEDTTLYVFFTTQITTGARTDFANVLEDADIVLVKDGTVATITATLTHTLTFNSDAGIYKLAIDLSGDADFTKGSDWTVYGHPDTEQLGSVDLAFIICTFTIETLAQQSERVYSEKMYGAGYILGASASHSATVIDMTGVIDADTPASAVIGEVLDFWDASTGVVYKVRCTAFAVTTLLATVQALNTGVTLPVPVSGDMVWRNGQFTANVVQLVGNSGDATNLGSAANNYSATRGLAGTALPAVAAEAAGGLFTRGTGAGQINQEANGLVDVNVVEMNETPVIGVGIAGNKWRA